MKKTIVFGSLIVCFLMLSSPLFSYADGARNRETPKNMAQITAVAWSKECTKIVSCTVIGDNGKTDSDDKSVDVTIDSYFFSVNVRGRFLRHWYPTPRNLVWQIDICNADGATIPIPDGRLFYEIWVEEENLKTGDIYWHPKGMGTLHSIDIGKCVTLNMEHFGHNYDMKYSGYCKVTDWWTKVIKIAKWSVTISLKLSTDLQQEMKIYLPQYLPLSLR